MSKIEELEKLIVHHKIQYYRGTPEISDDEYDKIEDKLRKLDPHNAHLSLVGAILNENKVRHDTKMLSLDKTYDIDDLKKWMGSHKTVSMHKIDGVSCSLVYVNGRLTIAKTRGDGTFGENITSKALFIADIPKHLHNANYEKVEIRGELFCSEGDFYRLSNEMVNKELEKPTSQRNIVAGLVSRKDNAELCSHLSFQAFDFIDLLHDSINEELEKYKILKSNNFRVPEIKVHNSPEDVDNAVNEAKDFMSEGDYQIDGLVFCFNDVRLQHEMGNTSHHPKYKIAFKFKGDTKQTRINEIEWSISRNGILTPIAIVEPVLLSGAQLSRVTLHNYGMALQHNLKKGDLIEIIRSGEVIPKFLRVIESSNEKFEIPERCPVCESKLKIEEIRLYCRNENCPGKKKEIILNFIQKMGIDDLSSKRLEEMIKTGLVKSIPDLYKVKVEELLKLEKVKDKLANKLVDNIQASTHVDFVTFLSALGISGGAYNKCEKVVSSGINDLEKLRNLSKERLIEVDSFAELSATEFLESLGEKWSLIAQLEKIGFEFKEKNSNKNNGLEGKKLCITGALSEKRTVIESKIRDSGGTVVNSVSKNTDFLVTNERDTNSSKMQKAMEFGTIIISEDELKDYL